MITPEHELSVRGLLLDALTCMRSAHEEMLRGNYHRAEMYLTKAAVITEETRRQTTALAAGQNLASQPPA